MIAATHRASDRVQLSGRPIGRIVLRGVRHQGGRGWCHHRAAGRSAPVSEPTQGKGEYARIEQLSLFMRASARLCWRRAQPCAGGGAHEAGTLTVPCLTLVKLVHQVVAVSSSSHHIVHLAQGAESDLATNGNQCGVHSGRSGHPCNNHPKRGSDGAAPRPPLRTNEFSAA